MPRTMVPGSGRWGSNLMHDVQEREAAEADPSRGTSQPPTSALARTERLCERHIPALVVLHGALLGYSLNARLGSRHLEKLYRETASSSTGMVTVALLGSEVVGGVSATVDSREQLRQMLRKTPGSEMLRMVLRAAFLPQCWASILETFGHETLPTHHDQPIRGELTSIVVSLSCQRKGVGRALVEAVDGFFRSRGVAVYRLETRMANASSQAFYRRLGFTECGTRGRNIVFVRKLA